MGGYHGFDSFSDTYQITGELASDVREAVFSAIDNVKVEVGANGAFTGTPAASFDNRDATMASDGTISIRTDHDNQVPEMQLCLHESKWAALGYDVRLQRNPEIIDEDPLLYVFFNRGEQSYFPFMGFSRSDTPGPGYYTAFFSTIPAAILAGLEQGNSALETNEGNARVYRPLYPGGFQRLPHDIPSSGFEVVLDVFDGVQHPGQFDRPPAADPVDPTSGIDVGGNEANAQGIWMFVGPFRRRPDEDPETEVQFALCSWANAALEGQVAGTPPRIRSLRWLDPKRFGYEHSSLTQRSQSWSVRTDGDDEVLVKAFPVFRLGYSDHDHRSRWTTEFHRLLVTTGASEGWTGFEGDPSATVDLTSNEPAGSSVPLDVEIADLGLGLPSSLVAPRSEWTDLYERLPENHDAGWDLIVEPGFEVSQLFFGWAKTLGLAWGFSNGQFRVFDPTAILTPNDAEVVITQGEVRSSGTPSRDVTRQSLRATQPIETWKVQRKYQPHTGEFLREQDVPSRDRGARSRAKGDQWLADGYGFQQLTPGYTQRVTQVSKFYEGRSMWIRDYPLLLSTGQNVGPGTKVLLTDPQVVGQDGTYGIVGYVGIVTMKEEDTDSRRGGIRVDIFVQDTVAQAVKLLAPIARSYGIDTDNDRILVRDNFLGLIAPGHFDATRFVEPSWSSLGGDLDVEGHWLHDPNPSGTPDWTGTVVSVNAETDNSYLQLDGPVSGTYLRDRSYYVIPREHANQGAAWALALLAIIGDEDGEFGASERSSRWHDA